MINFIILIVFILIFAELNYDVVNNNLKNSDDEN